MLYCRLTLRFQYNTEKGMSRDVKASISKIELIQSRVIIKKRHWYVLALPGFGWVGGKVYRNASTSDVRILRSLH